MPVIGTRQSPIQLRTDESLRLATPHELMRIEYENKAYPGSFKGQSGHGNFELDYTNRPAATSPSVVFQGHVFELRRIHIHFKSEHLIDATEKRDYELHLVHVRSGMSLFDPKLVIGILYHESATTPAGKGLEQFNDLLRKRKQAGKSLKTFKPNDPDCRVHLNPLEFFPRASDGKSPDLTNWFYYEGSLTSEPYSEDVSWFVMKNESAIDPAKLEALEEYAEQESRPTFALDRRIVVRSF